MAGRLPGEAANRAKDAFIATVSHQLRTPLNAILGWVELLKGGGLDAEASHRALDTVRRNAKSQARLIDDLLDVTRIMSGSLRIDVRPVELAPILDAAVETLRPAAAKKGVAIETAIDPETGLLEGDADRLKQVAVNLLSNAVKFTPDGGRVDVVLRRSVNSAVFEVRDSGLGIDPALVEQIFTPFWQADSSTTRRSGGLGLGLAIVRQLVELHDGSVAAESEGQGHGTTVTVRLPLAAEHCSGSPSDGKPALSELAGVLDGVRVVFADDNGDARAFGATTLEACGATVTLVGTAAEALEAVERWRPDVLVTDIGMPDEDGYSLLRRLRALGPEQGGDTTAVAVTAYAGAEERERALRAGFQIHLGKPVEPASLVSAVDDLLKRS